MTMRSTLSRRASILRGILCLIFAGFRTLDSIVRTRQSVLIPTTLLSIPAPNRERALCLRRIWAFRRGVTRYFQKYATVRLREFGARFSALAWDSYIFKREPRFRPAGTYSHAASGAECIACGYPAVTPEQLGLNWKRRKGKMMIFVILAFLLLPLFASVRRWKGWRTGAVDKVVKNARETFRFMSIAMPSRTILVLSFFLCFILPVAVFYLLE